MKIAHIKFSDFNEFVNWCNQLAIHFARLAWAYLSEKTKTAKIAKFSVLLIIAMYI